MGGPNGTCRGVRSAAVASNAISRKSGCRPERAWPPQLRARAGDQQSPDHSPCRSATSDPATAVVVRASGGGADILEREHGRRPDDWRGGGCAYESHGARVLEVRIRLPPAKSQRTFSPSNRRRLRMTSSGHAGPRADALAGEDRSETRVAVILRAIRPGATRPPARLYFSGLRNGPRGSRWRPIPVGSQARFSNDQYHGWHDYPVAAGQRHQSQLQGD